MVFKFKPKPRVFFATFIIAIVAVALNSTSTYADIVWGGGSGSNTASCQNICRPTGWDGGVEVAGATWRHYNWWDRPSGVTPYDDHIDIAGESTWAPSGSIWPGNKLQLCKEQGYWRYSHVAYASGQNDWGGWFGYGDQLGLHSIGDTDPGDGINRASEFFDGGTFQYNEGQSTPIDGVQSFWKVKELYVNFGGNGDDWNESSSLSWFCGGTIPSHMTSYHSHSSVTVSDGTGSSKTVDSAWDRFNSGSYETTKDKVTVTFTHQLGRRADSENVKSNNINWQLFGGLNSSWSSGVSGNQSFSSNYNTQVNSNRHTNVSVPAGTTKTFCQGLRHRIRVDVNNNGDAISSQPDTREATSEACVSVTNIGDTSRDPSDPTTSTAYIGEPNSIQWGTGQYHAYFYVGSGTTQNQVGTSTQSGSTQPYGTMGRSATPPALPNSASTICNHYPIPGKIGNSCSDGVSGNFTTPDNLSYVGAKICAASVTTNSEFDHYEYDTETRSRKDVNGNTVTETIQVPVPIYRYYLKFSNASCSPIAKKPNFQVTGGTLYSYENIAALAAKKNNKYYTSWSEYLAITSSGKISTSGYKLFGSGGIYRNGSAESSAGNISKLSIANNTNTIGKSGITSSAENFINGINNYLKNNPNVDFKNPNDVRWSSTVSGANGKQLIIYSKGDINIPPSTRTINGWVISENGTINTCSDFANRADIHGAGDCNSQLTINGIAYAKYFKLFRTAVSTGINSNYSAEVFNLKPSVYTWSYQQAKSQSKQVSEVYLQELSPRI